ncbi:hypothetical protein LH205_003092, partial [Vibrio cholerae]
MSIDELKNVISSELKSGNFTLQAIFDRHIGDIEELLKSGMRHSSLYKDLGLSVNHYKSLIGRARNKRNKQKKVI